MRAVFSLRLQHLPYPYPRVSSADSGVFAAASAMTVVFDEIASLCDKSHNSQRLGFPVGGELADIGPIKETS